LYRPRQAGILEVWSATPSREKKIKDLKAVHLRKARASDAETLAQASERAFHNDVHYGAPSPEGGPPGYNSAAWQKRMMRAGEYYTILYGEQIVGGVIVFRKGTREYELGRIFIEPEFQNQGIGTMAFDYLWQTYPLAKRWTLGTPKWNRRTRHFYAKVGFTEIGEDSHGGVLFERRIPARSG
jgi:RimJ/RimL family protein N-acetyltransferase